MKKLTIGILAHVDAGKTTLSEALLFKTGAIRKLGRVDNRDTLLDTDAIERARGITILSKCARFQTENTEFTLLDTPGHVDFGTEAERVLSVLDLAVLVISGTEGVQSHTKTLWRLLMAYKVPVLIFVNKCDMPGFNKGLVLQNLKALFSSACVDFTHVVFTEGGSHGHDDASVTAPADISEEIAVCDEEMLEAYLEGESLDFLHISHAFSARRLFPVCFGSALRLNGIDELIRVLDVLPEYPVYELPADLKAKSPDAFYARCFKIFRDENAVRLCLIKILSGSLSLRDSIGDEKVSGLRLYSGDKYKSVQRAVTGDIVAISGTDSINSGMSFGSDGAADACASWMLEPTVSYRLILPDGSDPALLLPRLRTLEEEDPTLSIIWDELHKDILLHVMGNVHIEILKSRIKERFNVDAEFGSGRIIYKETIADTSLGFGHFEPLRHYAEVHVMLTPLERGSGIVIENKCSSDILAGHWQKQILSVLAAKHHKGVLTGSRLTDVKITLLSGKAHPKHTEGGDFRQAANRAVRQGLMKAAPVLLEPYYSYELSVPAECVGRAMTDLKMRGASMELTESTLITGLIPASALGDYRLELASYTKGLGSLSTFPAGYDKCHNTEEVLAELNYDAQADLRNTPDSVFCSHGSSFTVSWNEAEECMHLPVEELNPADPSGVMIMQAAPRTGTMTTAEKLDMTLGTDDIDDILNKTFYSNSSKNVDSKREKMRASAAEELEWMNEDHENASQKNARPYKGQERPFVPEESYLLVDGYNVIFAWQELNELANVNIDGARGRLLDILCDYQAQKGMNLIVVFDAYRVKGHDEEYSDYRNIHVVYTKTAETADRYIERFATDFGRKYHVRVVTSDGVEQIIIRGNGCVLTSSREFEGEVKTVQDEISKKIEGRVF